MNADRTMREFKQRTAIEEQMGTLGQDKHPDSVIEIQFAREIKKNQNVSKLQHLAPIAVGFTFLHSFAKLQIERARRMGGLSDDPK